MGTLQQVAWYITAPFILIISLLMQQSCIKDDLSHCLPTEVVLYIKVIDVVTGRDMTETGEVEQASLYLFDRNHVLLNRYYLSAEQIARREPLVLKEYDPERMFLSAWGNIGEQVKFTEVSKGGKAEELTLSLLADPYESGYSLFPNDFFFGRKEWNGNYGKTSIEEVVLTQKNAKLYVTVRGLKDTHADHYYFQIVNKYNGYNYQGIPTANLSYLKEKGVFNSHHEYVSPGPDLLIHSADQYHAVEDNSVWIYLYKNEEGIPEELVKTNRDTTGNYITLISGKTTNVLIDLTNGNTGELTVQIQVTPWDEIYQWERW